MPASKHADNPQAEQPFISHLLELRDRILRMVAAIFVVFLMLFPFANELYIYVATPLMAHMPADTSMIATGVAAPFLTPFKLSLMAAVFLTMPYILYQFWGFIAPGLYQHEKKLATPLLISSILLFYLGMAFAYFVVFPLVFGFLTGVAPQGVAVMTDITHYLDFVLTLFFAFGLAFEVPIATIVLVLAGVTSPEKLATKRPYVIVGAFVIGMLLTPPDIISQTLLALPMWVLFEVGLVFSRLVVREKARREAAADAEAVTTVPAAQEASQPAASTADEGSFRPLDEQEMEDEFDRIEREFDALDEAPPSSTSTADDAPADSRHTPHETHPPSPHPPASVPESSVDGPGEVTAMRLIANELAEILDRVARGRRCRRELSFRCCFC